jgi:hypothetical protein
MTATPRDRALPDPGSSPGSGILNEPEDVDVLYLAGQRPAPEGEWLLITEVDGAPGATFSAWVLPPGGRHAHGGDVVIRLAPGTGGEPDTVEVSVWVVIRSLLIPVAAWSREDPDGWPERIRPAAAFAMGILTELEEHPGAYIGAGDQVSLDAAAARAVPGIPLHMTAGPPAAR